MLLNVQVTCNIYNKCAPHYFVLHQRTLGYVCAVYMINFFHQRKKVGRKTPCPTLYMIGFSGFCDSRFAYVYANVLVRCTCASSAIDKNLEYSYKLQCVHPRGQT